MPANVVQTPEQERLWNKAKRIAKKQGRDKDYSYVMGIFKKMKGMEKSGMPGLSKLGQNNIWKVAQNKARQAGKDRDYEYVLKLYKEMSGWKSLSHSGNGPDLEKSYLYPQSTLSHARVPGQIPSKEAIDALRLAETTPKQFSIARLMAHDEPILNTSSIVDDLGFDMAKKKDWTKFLETTLKSSSNELVLRQDVMSKCINERMEGALRSAILQRSLSCWKSYRKSMVEIVNPKESLEKAEARGGKYHRRVPREKGGYTYYYDEDKYKTSKQAHTSGEEGTHSYVSGKLEKCISNLGTKGCGPEAFADLVKKYGSKVVADILRKDVGTKYTFEKGKFFLKKTKKPKEEVKKSRFYIILDDSLEKSGPHKYISRKKDAKGNWVYEYPEDKKKRIINLILDFLKSPKRSLTVSSTARSFRVDKGLAGQILRDLESQGKISKQGVEYIGDQKEKPSVKAPEPKLVVPKETPEIDKDQQKFVFATVEKDKTESQINKEEEGERLGVGILSTGKLNGLKDRGLMVVSKKSSDKKTNAELEAIGILSGAKFKQMVDAGLTVEWMPGALPKIEPPKDSKSTKESKKTSEKRLEQTGDHIWGSRKDLASIGRITDSKQLEGMSYDDAAHIVRKSKVVPVHDLNTLKAMGMTPGTAHMSIALLASIKNKPGDSKAERAAYVDQIREVTGGIQEAKTVKEFRDMLNEFSLNRRSASQWETIERVSDRDEARKRIAQLERDNPGVDYGMRFSYSTNKAEIAKKVARPYDALGPRFTKFIDQAGKFYHAAYGEAMTVDKLWSYSKDEDIGDGWAYLQEADQKKKDAKKKSVKKPKNTKRGWSGAKDVAGEVQRVGGNVDIEKASSERTKTTFNLREVDYGKEGYMTQADREYHTKALEEALHDFSEILGISPDTISFNGRLGIALGARGRGKAKAHYEPINKALNITKFRGGGSVAHEWGHALDNIIAGHFITSKTGSSKGDSFLSKTPNHSKLPKEISEAITDVMDDVTKHPDPKKAKIEHDKYINKLRLEADKLIGENNSLVSEHKKIQNKPENREKADKRIKGMELRIEEYQRYIDTEKPKLEAQTKSGRKIKFERELDILNRERWIKENKDKIASLKKSDAILSPKDKERMENIKDKIESLRIPINNTRAKLNQLAKMDPTVSDYYKSGQILGKDYWGSPEELFARAFESYVQDSLKSKQRANTYLVDGTTAVYSTGIPVSSTGTIQPYPQGEERKRINASMKKLVDAIKSTKSLEKSLQKLYIRV